MTTSWCYPSDNEEVLGPNVSAISMYGTGVKELVTRHQAKDQAPALYSHPSPRVRGNTDQICRRVYSVTFNASTTDALLLTVSYASFPKLGSWGPQKKI